MGPKYVLVSSLGILWRTDVEGAALSNCASLCVAASEWVGRTLSGHTSDISLTLEAPKLQGRRSILLQHPSISDRTASKRIERFRARLLSSVILVGAKELSFAPCARGMKIFKRLAPTLRPPRIALAAPLPSNCKDAEPSPSVACVVHVCPSPVSRITCHVCCNGFSGPRASSN